MNIIRDLERTHNSDVHTGNEDSHSKSTATIITESVGDNGEPENLILNGSTNTGITWPQVTALRLLRISVENLGWTSDCRPQVVAGRKSCPDDDSLLAGFRHPQAKFTVTWQDISSRVYPMELEPKQQGDIARISAREPLDPVYVRLPGSNQIHRFGTRMGGHRGELNGHAALERVLPEDSRVTERSVWLGGFASLIRLSKMPIFPIAGRWCLRRLIGGKWWPRQATRHRNPCN